MQKPRIVLSFDDGRRDNYDIVVPILKKYGLTATFNIATAYIDGSISAEDSPCANAAMTVDEIVELHNNGFEIACHGDCHKNDWDDIMNGLRKLKFWLGWDEGYKPGFASPQSNLSSNNINKNINEYKKYFAYMRIASYDKDSIIKRIIRKVAHSSRNCFLYEKAFGDNIGGIKDGFIAVSVPVVNMATTDQVKAIVNRSIKAKQDVILMFHSIVQNDDTYAEDMWSWDTIKFESLCQWLTEEIKLECLEVVRTIELFERRD